MHPAQSLIERLERALALAAYIVLKHGPVYAPYLDRLESELEAARRTDEVERANRILEAYGDALPTLQPADQMRSSRAKRV